MNKCQYCAVPYKLNQQTKVYSCRCGANGYAICRCCSTVCTPQNTFKWFDKPDSTLHYRYRLVCALCGDSYCPHCANLAFYSVGGVDDDDDITDICHRCVCEKREKPQQSDLARLTFSNWSITYHVATIDREQRLQTNVAVCPQVCERLEEALVAAESYTRTLFQTKLDASDFKPCCKPYKSA